MIADSEYDSECCICYTDMVIGKCFKRTLKIDFQCKHSLCLDCLHNLIIQNKNYFSAKCPLCRQDLIINDRLLDLFYMISDDYYSRKISGHWSNKNLLFRIRLCQIVTRNLIQQNLRFNFYDNELIRYIRFNYIKDLTDFSILNNLDNNIFKIKFNILIYSTWRNDDKFKLKLCLVILNKFQNFYKKNKLLNYNFLFMTYKLKIDYQKDLSSILQMYD